MGFKVGKVFSQVDDFLLERPFAGFGVAELDFQGVDGSGLFGFDVEEDVDFHFHVIFLSFDVFEEGLESFGVELFSG